MIVKFNINSNLTDTNQRCNGMLRQQKFLTNLLEKLESEKSYEVVDSMVRIRSIISDPANLVLYFAGGLDQLKCPVKVIKDFLPAELNDRMKQQR